MNLLPKSSSEFSQQDYWDKFFKNRGKQAFEWYGNYHQLCAVLHKYMNAKDNILVGGCGNSTLSADLYNAGFKSITNVDISETVITQMTQQHAVSHPGMKFTVMDLLNMTFDSESFTCFLDKGTLDALMSDKDLESQQRAQKMFQEIDRVLKVGGRYICISLLQEHILECVTSHFHNQGWMVRICRCEEAEQHDEKIGARKGKRPSERFPFPVFAVICTKFKKMANFTPLLEYSPTENNIERIASLEELKSRVQSVQHFATLCHQYSSSDGRVSQQDISIELMDPKSTKKSPKYTLFVVDRRCKSVNKFAAFVVPQGRETDWIFSCNEGRHQLADNAKFQRLVVIHLGRDHQFASLQDVQNELGPVVSSLQPDDLPPSYQIPFLSLGASVNQRKEIHRGVSESTGEYVVEEVEEEEDGKPVILRRLIFLSNPNVIQSEARLKKGKVDLKYLACQHHLVMVEELEQHVKHNPDLESVLVLGLGGGALCTYLHQKFPSLSIEGVDIDSTMVDLAKRYFGFNPDDNLKAHVADGLVFIRDTVASGERYGCIMLDVDCKDRSLGMSCPPPSFVEMTFINTLKSCLVSNGLFLLNLVCRDERRRNEVTEVLRESFAAVQVRKIKGEVNEIISCSNVKNRSNRPAKS